MLLLLSILFLFSVLVPVDVFVLVVGLVLVLARYTYSSNMGGGVVFRAVDWFTYVVCIHRKEENGSRILCLRPARDKRYKREEISETPQSVASTGQLRAFCICMV